MSRASLEFAGPEPAVPALEVKKLRRCCWHPFTALSFVGLATHTASLSSVVSFRLVLPLSGSSGSFSFQVKANFLCVAAVPSRS